METPSFVWFVYLLVLADGLFFISEIHASYFMTLKWTLGLIEDNVVPGDCYF